MLTKLNKKRHTMYLWSDYFTKDGNVFAYTVENLKNQRRDVLPLWQRIFLAPVYAISIIYYCLKGVPVELNVWEDK